MGYPHNLSCPRNNSDYLSNGSAKYSYNILFCNSNAQGATMAKNHKCDNGTRIVLLRLVCFKPGNPIPMIHKNLVVTKVFQCFKIQHIFIYFIHFILFIPLKEGFPLNVQSTTHNIHLSKIILGIT